MKLIVAPPDDAVADIGTLTLVPVVKLNVAPFEGEVIEAVGPAPVTVTVRVVLAVVPLLSVALSSIMCMPTLNALLALTLLVPVANTTPASMSSNLLMVAPPDAVADPENATVAVAPLAATEMLEVG